MKCYSPTGRPLKRLLDTWDRNGSTSGPTPWQIYDDDDKTYKQKYKNNHHFENIAITAKINVTFHSRMKGKCGVLCNTNTFWSCDISRWFAFVKCLIYAAQPV
jgi:hypothetical protein